MLSQKQINWLQVFGKREAKGITCVILHFGRSQAIMIRKHFVGEKPEKDIEGLHTYRPNRSLYSERETRFIAHYSEIQVWGKDKNNGKLLKELH